MMKMIRLILKRMDDNYKVNQEIRNREKGIIRDHDILKDRKDL